MQLAQLEFSSQELRIKTLGAIRRALSDGWTWDESLSRALATSQDRAILCYTKDIRVRVWDLNGMDRTCLKSNVLKLFN